MFVLKLNKSQIGHGKISEGHFQENRGPALRNSKQGTSELEISVLSHRQPSPPCWDGGGVPSLQMKNLIFLFNSKYTDGSKEQMTRLDSF